MNNIQKRKNRLLLSAINSLDSAIKDHSNLFLSERLYLINKIEDPKITFLNTERKELEKKIHSIIENIYKIIDKQNTDVIVEYTDPYEDVEF